MSLYLKSQNFTDDSHIYYNMNFTSGADAGIPNITQNLIYPLITNPSEYHLSIVRFTLPTDLIPLFGWPQTSAQAADNAFYSVSLEWDGYITQVFLTYFSLDGPDATFVGLREPLFPIFYYQHFIDIVNIALETAFTNLMTAKPLAPVTVRPYFLYDTRTNKFSLVAPSGYWPSGGTTAPKIYINTPMEKYFEPIMTYYNGNTTSFGRNGIIPVKNNLNNTVTNALAGAGLSYEMVCEYNNPASWRDIVSIIFTSSSLKSRAEFLPDPTGEGRPTTSGIITDFAFPPDIFGRPDVEYLPTAQYRLVDLVGNDTINDVQIAIKWITSNGVVYNLVIPPYRNVSVKLIFQQK